VANVPHETLLTSCASVDDVHGSKADNTSDSNDTTNDANNEDSFHHALSTSFHDGLLTLVSHHQCVVTNYDRQERLLVSLVSGLWRGYSLTGIRPPSMV
jgi:hypothetical protein